MKFNETERVKELLDEIKEIVIENFNLKNPNKFTIPYTKKKTLLVIPIPFNSPAFQLFVNNKFYKSYFMQNNKWSELTE